MKINFLSIHCVVLEFSKQQLNIRIKESANLILSKDSYSLDTINGSVIGIMHNIKQLKKKYHLLLILLTMLHLASGAQNGMRSLIYKDDFSIIDTVKYEIVYELEFVDDSLKPEEKLVDLQVLQIGTNSSKYFSKLLFRNDSLNTILEKNNATNILSEPKNAALYDVIRDRKAKKVTVTHRSDDIVFRYSEAIPNINWTIHNENKRILDYTCQRATAKFRGRVYEVWFAPEIPLREGPYKFVGLPGLILEMADSQKHYVYKCISLRQPKAVEQMKIRNWSYTETTRQKLNDFLVRKHENPTEYYNSRGVVSMTKINGRFVETSKSFSLPYNPIELE